MAAMLLYVHGFNSSALSLKAQQMSQWCAQYRPDICVLTPTLASYPVDAINQLAGLIDTHQKQYQIGLVGSSLGGYYSTWLNAQSALRSVLVNPAVKPYQLLADYLGPQQNPYTGEQYLLESRHLDELLALDVGSIARPETIWLLQQQGDEVLDYQQAVTQYQGCKQTVEVNGNHAFVGFDRYCADIIDFLAL